MTINEVLQRIDDLNGKIFTIKFEKRTDRTIREMTCRQGVKKYLANNPDRPGLDFGKHKLIPVYDMVEQGYRSIPIEGIIAIKVEGEWHNIEHNSIKV